MEKEILANAMSMQEEEEDDIDPQRNNEVEEVSVNEPTKEILLSAAADDAHSIASSKSDLKNETTQLMNIQSSSPKSGIKVSGTLKLMKPFEVQPYSNKYKDLNDIDIADAGCLPRWAVTIWATLFD